MKEIITAYDNPMVADLNKQKVDFSNVGNRRFMYNPKTGTFFLGKEDGKGNGIVSSHSEEFHQAGITEDFDDFVRGWLGYNRSTYRHGIIHFAPNIIKPQFNRGFDTLQVLIKQTGIDGMTKVRGFVSFGEIQMKELLPESCRA